MASGAPTPALVLKVMHVLQHLSGREIITRLAVSADQIFRAVEDKSCAPSRNEGRGLRHRGVRVESQGKPDSLITKLLAKRGKPPKPFAAERIVF